MKKLILPIIAVIVLILVFVLAGSRSEKAAPEQETGTVEEEEVTAPLPPASGNVDDIISEFNDDAATDQSFFTDETGDEALIKSDSEAAGNVGSAYDPNEF